jgi:glycosyltransferase involved in cell wall biosynthesis
MKITIATGPIFPVPTVRGGAAQRVWEGLLPEFLKRGHEVTVFAREFPGQPRQEMIDGIRYVRWGGYEQSTSIKRDLLMCLIYALRASLRMPTGDVVVTNDFWMPAVLPLMNGKAGKVIASIARFPKGQFFLYKKCAMVAPVSESVAQGIREQTPEIADKVTVVPNCVDAAFLAPLPPKEARSSVRILFVGRIHPEKGLGLLASALRLIAEAKRHEVRGWECVLLGPVKQSEGGGGEAFAKELRRQLEGLPVRFDPPVYDLKELAGIYDTGDILVYPSVADTGEAMPLAPLEGMARGLVPVVSDLAAFREYLEPGINGEVFNHRGSDAAANLAAALRRLIGDTDLRERVGTAARETAEKFSPEVIANKYLQLFEKTVLGTRQ